MISCVYTFIYIYIYIFYTVHTTVLYKRIWPPVPGHWPGVKAHALKRETARQLDLDGALPATRAKRR